MTDDPPMQSAGEAGVEQKVAEASGWCVVLGAVSLIAVFFQLFGVIDPGVPVLVNLAVPAALIVGGLRLNKRSILSAGILVALFMAMAVNTLVVTGQVLGGGGVILTGLLILRYVILASATRALGQAFVGILEYQRTEVKPDAFKRADNATSAENASGAPVRDLPSRHQPPQAVPSPSVSGPVLSRGFNGAVVYFTCFAVAMALLGLLVLVLEAFEDVPGFLKITPFLLSGVGAYAASAENRFFPEKVTALKAAIMNGDQKAASDARTALIDKGRRASRALAVGALEARSEAKASSFVTAAFDMIGDIGILEQDAAAAIHAHFIEQENEQASRYAAQRALRSIGYSL